MKLYSLSITVIYYYVFLFPMMMNRPNSVIIPPIMMGAFNTCPGNKYQANMEAIKGSPNGIDDTMVGERCFVK